MDRSEEIARVYLEGLDLGPVIYEPDGRVPPDFAVGNVGIEVRRLNQNYEAGGVHEGLESAEAALLRYVERTLASFGPAPEGKGWWVSYTFWRPLDGKAVKAALPKALAAFKEAPVPGGGEGLLTPRFELEIRPASIPVEQLYMLGAFSDRDAGGFVASEIIRNLNLCIREKAAKITPFLDRYSEWWLVLPDLIGPDLNAEERGTIGQHIDLGPFSRVVLLHPRNPAVALELSHPSDVATACPSERD